MSKIFYFPRYRQGENSFTNNTLLLLLRLHQHNRYKFEKLLLSLCEDNWSGFTFDKDTALGLNFKQQERGTGSIPDGFIAQPSIRIAVETKVTAGTFRAEQLRGHLRALGGETEIKILFLLAPDKPHRDGAAVRDAVRRAQRQKPPVVIAAITFQMLISQIRQLIGEHEESMQELLNDFEDYCIEKNLIPRENFTLFIPPCGASFDENREFKLYYCPAEWKRRWSRFLGIYKNRSVHLIGQIAKRVEVDIDLKHQKVKTIAGGGPLTREEERRLIFAAEHARQARGWNLSKGHQFFLCDELETTDYRKTTPGGIMGHRYIELDQILPSMSPSTSLKTIAAALKDRTWQ